MSWRGLPRDIVVTPPQHLTHYLGVITYRTKDGDVLGETLLRVDVGGPSAPWRLPESAGV